MAYFDMSTANPTGQRAWNFVFNGGLSGRRLGKLRGLRFYLPANYPLPQSTLGRLGWAGANRNVPAIALSPFSGKNDYGDPGEPVYNPTNPFFYRSLDLSGLGRRGRMGAAFPIGRRPILSTGGPIFVTTPTPTPTQPSNPIPTPVATGNPPVWGGPIYVTTPGPGIVTAAGSSLCQPANNPAAPAGYQWQPTQTDANGCPTNYQLFAIGSNTPTSLAAAQQQVIAAQQAAAAASIAAQAAASGQAIPSSTVATTAVASAPSWFTDPNQELINGIPNWGLLGAAALAVVLLMGKKR